MDRSEDRKAKASGEREDELPKSEREKSLEYAEEVLDTLLRFSSPPLESKSWSDDEWTEWRKDWIRRLSSVPIWKLKKLGDFTSPWINEVWHFFDTLRQEPEYYQEPTIPQIEHKSQIHKSVMEHVFYLYDISEPIHHARGKLRRLQEGQKKAANPQEYTVPLALAEKNLKEAIRAKRQHENESLAKLQKTYSHIKFI